MADSDLAQATLAGRGSETQHKPHSRPRGYALRGILLCGLCGRRISGKWNHDQAYYQCRFPAEYALANRISHPKNVYLKEADVLGHVDHWLAELSAPNSIAPPWTSSPSRPNSSTTPARAAGPNALERRHL